MSLLDNLQAYFKADESSGTMADQVNGNTLTNNNTATFTAGKINNALTLASASSQWMSRTDADCVGIDFNATSFTINCWVNWTTAVPSSNTVACFAGKMESGNRQYSFNQFNNAGTQTLYAEIGLGADTADGQSVNWTPSAATWYMVTFRYTTGTKKGDFSVNGSAQGAQVTFVNDLATDVSDFRVGSAFGGRFMDGQIDEMGLWDRRLTDQEITTLYNRGAGLSIPFTIGRLNLNKLRPRIFAPGLAR